MIRALSYRINHKRVGLLCLALFLVMQHGGVRAQSTTAKDHSPNKALILSAVLPGAGQAYNHQAWKIPIVYAALGGMGYYTLYNYREMKSYKDEYLYRVNHDDTPLEADYAAFPTSNIYNLYETYNKSFQLSVIITVAVYGLNLIDAYVFGHLFDFQITDDLTLNVSPELLPSGGGKLWGNNGFSFVPAASIRLTF